ncbi:phage major capsid protein, partial [Acinetobacter baumannii]|nr:phage major capsid protein [Acinetobacter baumannii]
VKSNLPKGIGFAQYAQAKIVSQLNAKEGRFESPLEVAKRMGFGDEVQDLITKATLGTTTDAGFAATLVHENQLVGEFVELLRQATVFDKLQGFRAVPFRSKIPSQVTGGTASWVGEGAAKPLTNPTFGEVEIGEHKLAAITVYTQELMRRSDPSVSVLVRDDLIAASAALVDATFLDSVAASAVRPAGVLNGVTATPNTGETAAAYEKDLLALINTFVTNNLSLDGAYFLMSETRAAQIALLRDALGNSYFNGMALRGSRTLLGIPVITSQSLGNKIILVKTSEILLAQDGGVDVSYSDQATLVDGSTTHHLWQENKFAVRVEKFITWAKRRPVAAAYLDYTTTPTP